MPEEARRRDQLAGIFAFGLILFNPPLLNLFSGGTILGWPLLYAYLFGAWGSIIACRRHRGGAPPPMARPGRQRGLTVLNPVLIAAVAIGYLLVLFAIAYAVDRQPGHGARAINSSVVYTLSLAIYCTSWTFYGSVGRASKNGFEFLPIYLGPTLAFCLGWLLLRKMLRVSKANRITSIASFVASRYGKSASLGGLVAAWPWSGRCPTLPCSSRRCPPASPPSPTTRRFPFNPRRCRS